MESDDMEEVVEDEEDVNRNELENIAGNDEVVKIYN